MRTFHELIEDFIEKTTNIFSTDIDNKWLRRYFMAGKIISILIPIGFCIYVGLASTTKGIQFSEYLASNRALPLLFLASMLCIFIAYVLKGIEWHFVDGETEAAVTNLIILLVSQIVLINLLYIFLLAIIIYRSKNIYKYNILDNFKVKEIPKHCKLGMLISLLNIFIIAQAATIGIG